MRRLVYSPKVQAYINTDAGIIDISDFIVSGQVQRVVNEVSTAELVIRNPNMRWTSPGEPTFRPMDAITVFMSRYRNYPIQTFTGYLDETPYLQLFPGTCTLRASCTLKRLMYTYFDPGLPYTWAFLNKYGWIQDTSTGQVRNPQALAQQRNNPNGPPQITDGSIGNLLYATLTDIGNWDQGQILIENLPDSIVTTVQNLLSQLEQDDQELMREFQDFLSKMIGSSVTPGSQSGGAGGGGVAGDIQQYNHVYPHDGSTTGGGKPIPFNAAAKIAQSVGLPGITFAQIAQGESTLYPGATSTDGGYGLWQMTPRVQGADTVAAWNKIGSYFNPVNNAKQALVLLGGHPTVEGIRRNWFGTSHVTDWWKPYTGD
jgi:hypothetical protein